SGAEGVAAGSPGVVSGNQLQVPVHIPVNLCGSARRRMGGGYAGSRNEAGSGAAPR
ncbi:chaplin, partial [Kitasatospora sp. NPDC001574]